MKKALAVWSICLALGISYVAQAAPSDYVGSVSEVTVAERYGELSSEGEIFGEELVWEGAARRVKNTALISSNSSAAQQREILPGLTLGKIGELGAFREVKFAGPPGRRPEDEKKRQQQRRPAPRPQYNVNMSRPPAPRPASRPASRPQVQRITQPVQFRNSPRPQQNTNRSRVVPKSFPMQGRVAQGNPFDLGYRRSPQPAVHRITQPVQFRNAPRPTVRPRNNAGPGMPAQYNTNMNRPPRQNTNTSKVVPKSFPMQGRVAQGNPFDLGYRRSPQPTVHRITQPVQFRNAPRPTVRPRNNANPGMPAQYNTNMNRPPRQNVQGRVVPLRPLPSSPGYRPGPVVQPIRQPGMPLRPEHQPGMPRPYQPGYHRPGPIVQPIYQPGYYPQPVNPSYEGGSFKDVASLALREFAIVKLMSTALNKSMDAYRRISYAVDSSDTELLSAQNAMLASPSSQNNARAFKVMRDSTDMLEKRIINTMNYGSYEQRQRLEEALKYAKAKQQECYLCYAGAVPLGVSLVADAIASVKHCKGLGDFGNILKLGSIIVVGKNVANYYNDTMKFFKRIDKAAQTARQATGVIPERDEEALRERQEASEDIGEEA